MKKVFRGLVAGSLIGAAVGVAMLLRKNHGMAGGMKIEPNKLKRQTNRTVKMVKDHTNKWTSALKGGTEAISQRLARRNP